MIKTDEKLNGYMIFKSNQGTGDHLKNNLNPENLKPYSSGKLLGIVSSSPKISKGGHVFFKINSKNYEINCAVYKPTGITSVASKLIKGDKLLVGGGVRKASKHSSKNSKFRIHQNSPSRKTNRFQVILFVKTVTKT